MFDWTRPMPVALTNGPESFVPGGVVNGNGTVIYGLSELKSSELVRFDLTTRRFEPFLGGPSAFAMTFSPDGRSTAYTSLPDQRVWRADMNGRNARPLVHAPIQMKSPAWSPDNKWIAFLGMLDGEYFRIFLMPPDGPATPFPISREDRPQGIPSWSPDGQRLCYGDVPTEWGVPDGDEVLHIYDVGSEAVEHVAGSKGLWTCRWSPDGRQLAALTIANKEMMIRIQDLGTGEWRSLTNTRAVQELVWSADSQSIYYWADNSLRRVRVSDGMVTILKDLTDYPTNQWVGLAPDGSPLLVHYNGSKRLYALALGTR
jgi:Tol biopolymer transport system component